MAAGPLAMGLALISLALGGDVRADAPPLDPFDVVVIDAGHGGDDQGARGPTGALEKDVVLEVARELAAQLRAHGLRVVMTRSDDSFVPLERRTYIANDAKGDLFVSVHANAAANASIRGSETFFLSLDASDDASRLLAERENIAFGAAAAQGPQANDPLVAILGDLIATEHLTESQEFAGLAQGRLAQLAPDVSRGVKQAPFVVLTGVRMPASLLEIGFITNPSDERSMRSRQGRDAVVAALADAVAEFGRRYDARRGIGAKASRGGR
ncbi:MAG: N-acetylmuramoyl-L-alanine amidase [Deltaproteobacteria bacterium]|nr:N-acetylmuramoyl-L-alanine amidase [Deltaproteobacteria bacterium]